MTKLVGLASCDAEIRLFLTDGLLPHEKGAPLYLALLRETLLSDGLLRYPVIIDASTHVILDGVRRWLALKSLGCTLIPALTVDALNSKIRVEKREANCGDRLTITNVIKAGLEGRLMEPRSTRHVFPFSKFQPVNYPLCRLGKGPPQEVTPYLAKMTPLEAKAYLERWITETTAELNDLTRGKEKAGNNFKLFLAGIMELSKNAV